jgi:hypothetical protein
MRKDGLAFRSGAAILLAYDAASFITGRVIVVEGGFLASGVNQRRRPAVDL